MKAFVLAAGLGVRLKPITDYLPKPLIPVFGLTPLEICVNKILAAEIRDISVNVHHLPEKIIEFLNNKNIAVNISIESPEILGTGGGIGKLKNYFAGDDVIVHNADIISDLDIVRLSEIHRAAKNWATLALVKNPKTDGVLIDNNGIITDFDDPQKRGYTFSGISVISKEIYEQLPNNKFFNIIELYKKIICSPDLAKIRGVYFKSAFWSDIGAPASYWRLCADLAESGKLCAQFAIDSSDKNRELSVFKRDRAIFIASDENLSYQDAVVFKNNIVWRRTL